MLYRHDIEDHYSLGADILVDGTGLVHYEYFLISENFCGRQVIRYVYRHGTLI